MIVDLLCVMFINFFMIGCGKKNPKLNPPYHLFFSAAQLQPDEYTGGNGCAGTDGNCAEPAEYILSIKNLKFVQVLQIILILMMSLVMEQLQLVTPS